VSCLKEVVLYSPRTSYCLIITGNGETMPFVCLVSYLMWSQGVPSQFHFMAGSRYQTQRKLIAVLRQEKLLARLS
jgi:hypothetical protein